MGRARRDRRADHRRRGGRLLAIGAALAALFGGAPVVAQTETETGPVRVILRPPPAPAPVDPEEPEPELATPVGAVTADPVGAARREIEASCLQVDYPEAFSRWIDLNADGEDDVVLTYDVSCDGFPKVFCGIEGCGGAVFVAVGEGGYRRTSLPPDIEPREAFRGRPAVRLKRPAGNCGRLDNVACRTVRVWDGVDFVPPGRLGAGRTGAADATASLEQEPEAAAVDDHNATATLFWPQRVRAAARAAMAADAKARAEAEERRIEALATERGFVVAPAFRPARSSAQWGYEPLGRGRALARIDGPDRRSEVGIACRAGDRSIGFALVAASGPMAQDRADGEASSVDVVIGGRARETVLMRYAARSGFWVGRIAPNGPIGEWLRRGTSLTFFDAGAARRPENVAARFALSGSRRAIEAMYRACGLL